MLFFLHFSFETEHVLAMNMRVTTNHIVSRDQRNDTCVDRQFKLIKTLSVK